MSTIRNVLKWLVPPVGIVGIVILVYFIITTIEADKKYIPIAALIPFSLAFVVALYNLFGTTKLKYSPKSVRDISQKQLNEWKARNGKLYHTLHEDDEYIPMKLKDDKNEEYNVDDFLSKLRKKFCPHAIIIGEEGMGKTTTCMRLWEIYLKKKQVFYIPLYNYNIVNTVRKSIMETYNIETEFDYNHLMDNENVILLLDGFNEMKSKYNCDFFEELDKLSTKKNVQILITSRSDIVRFATIHFTKLTFEPINNEMTDKWLKEHVPNYITTALSKELYAVLSNPILLKIYAISVNGQSSSNQEQRTEFLSNPSTTGEIIWNFMEYQIVKSKNLREEKEGFSKILFRYLLPYIAYRIESQGDYHFTLIELNKYIDEFENYFKENYNKFDDLIYHEDIVHDFFNKKGRTKFLLDLCKDNFCIIRPITGNKEDTYSFIHQYFRDIFSATHLKNQMKLRDTTVFTERIIPFYISRMLFEILQEHKSVKPSKLRDYMQCFKNEFDENAQKGVFNCLQIIDYARNGNMSNEDFSELDLRLSSLGGKNSRNSKFLKSKINKQLFFTQGHTSNVRSASYSPDGRYIVSASWDNTIKIWESSTGNLVRTLEGHTNWVNSASYSPEGRYIVSASDDKTIKIWESSTANLVRTMEGHTSYVNSASYSPDGRYIVSAGDKTIKIWESSTGNLVRTMGHMDYQTSASYSPDGRYIVSASSDKTIKIWESGTGNLVRTMEGHTDYVNSASYSPDGRYIVSASNDNTIRIWENCTGNLVRTMKRHTGFVYSASYSPDGRYIISASWDGAIKILESSTGNLVRTMRRHTPIVNSAIYSPDGRYIVSASWDNTIKIWESSTGNLVRTMGHMDCETSAIYSPDGRYIVLTSRDKTIKILESSTGNLVRTMEGHTDRVNSVSYSPDGRYIVSASDDKTIKIWESRTGNLMQTIEGHTSSVYSASYSSDGRYIISAGDITIKIWESGTGNLVRTMEGHTNSVSSASYSPDGSYIVSASRDNTIKIWESSTGNLVRTMKGRKDSVKSASYSPDGRYIISSDFYCCTIKIWESSTGSLVRTIEGHADWVNSASFSPDGNYTVSASRDKTIKIWESSTGNLVRTMEGHTSSVNSASYSPDGRYIVSASNDNTIRIWDHSGRLLKVIYPLPYTEISGIDLRGAKYDDLSEHNILVLKQNGAIFD